MNSVLTLALSPHPSWVRYGQCAHLCFIRCDTKFAYQSFSALQAFFVAMSLHPEVLSNAQAELDKVVGGHRLPDYSDKEDLVYINAIVAESLRWHNGVPLSLAHCTTADDEFHGYFIPAGTIVLPNIWCMFS